MIKKLIVDIVSNVKTEDPLNERVYIIINITKDDGLSFTENFSVVPYPRTAEKDMSAIKEVLSIVLFYLKQQ